MVIKGKIWIFKMGRQTKSLIFCLTKAKSPVWRRKGRRREEEEEEEEEEEGEEGEEQMYVFFCMESSVFWMFRVIGMIARVFLWRLVCSKPRVLVERSHKTLIC